MMKLVSFASILAGLAIAAPANAASIIENFEGSSAGSSTPPSGWSLVQTAGTATYVTSAAGAGSNGSNGSGGSSGLAGQVTATAGVGNNGLPGAYLVSTQTVNLTGALSGTFDFRLIHESTFDDVGFILGDVANGITGTSAGELLYARITEGAPNALAGIIQDGTSAGTSDALDSQSATIADDTWYRAEFSWTPTSGTTGYFSITVNDFNPGAFSSRPRPSPGPGSCAWATRSRKADRATSSIDPP